MNHLIAVFKKLIINYDHPIYSKTLFKIASRYVDFWYGDNNLSRNKNGEFWLLNKIIPGANTVLDVGANKGDYSSEILKINPKVSIHAFEPDPRAFNELKKLNLTAVNLAAGAKVEQKQFNQNHQSTHNSFYITEGDDSKTITVTVTTLDEYCRKNNITHIDFLKVDVEGHEFFVFSGAEELLKRKAIDYIQFEFSGGTVFSRTFLKDFIDLFAKHNYSVYRIRSKDVELVEWRPDKERFTLTNYLAIRKGMKIPQ